MATSIVTSTICSHIYKYIFTSAICSHMATSHIYNIQSHLKSTVTSTSLQSHLQSTWLSHQNIYNYVCMYSDGILHISSHIYNLQVTSTIYTHSYKSDPHISSHIYYLQSHLQSHLLSTVTSTSHIHTSPVISTDYRFYSYTRIVHEIKQKKSPFLQSLDR